MISGSSVPDIAAPKQYQRFSIIIAVVMLAHILIVWCLLNVIQPYTFTTPPITNAIKVHFVSASALSPTAAVSEPIESQSTATPSPIKQDETKIIEATASKRVIEKKPLQQNKTLKSDTAIIQNTTSQQALTVKRQPNMTQTDSKAERMDQVTKLEQQQVNSLPQKQSNPKQTQSSTLQSSSKNSSTAQAQQNDIAQGQIQVEQANQVGQNQQQSRALNQPIQEQQPLRVSNIDVLSFGNIKYDDRILQNQDRILILTLYVDHKGLPTKIVIKQSSGVSSLDQIVVKAAEKSKFKPYKLNGQAMPIVVDYPFQLKPNQSR